MNFRRISFKK